MKNFKVINKLKEPVKDRMLLVEYIANNSEKTQKTIIITDPDGYFRLNANSIKKIFVYPKQDITNLDSTVPATRRNFVVHPDNIIEIDTINK